MTKMCPAFVHTYNIRESVCFRLFNKKKISSLFFRLKRGSFVYPFESLLSLIPINTHTLVIDRFKKKIPYTYKAI